MTDVDERLTGYSTAIARVTLYKAEHTRQVVEYGLDAEYMVIGYTNLLAKLLEDLETGKTVYREALQEPEGEE